MVGIIFKKRITMKIEEILQHDDLIEQKQLVDLVGGDGENSLLANSNTQDECHCYGKGENTNGAKGCFCSNYPPYIRPTDPSL